MLHVREWPFGFIFYNSRPFHFCRFGAPSSLNVQQYAGRGAEGCCEQFLLK